MADTQDTQSTQPAGPVVPGGTTVTAWGFVDADNDDPTFRAGPFTGELYCIDTPVGGRKYLVDCGDAQRAVDPHTITIDGKSPWA